MIAAIVLAAGLSRRMGRPKLTLPWGDTTVIGQVIGVLMQGGVEQVVVVTGGSEADVSPLARALGARTVLNPRYTEDDMIYSVQTGLQELEEGTEASLIALGDQPQIESQVVRSLVVLYRETRAQLIIPSYQMRRGHPWLVGRAYWDELLTAKAPATLRDFLEAHAGEITYVTVTTRSILMDLDTPEDYYRQRPDV